MNALHKCWTAAVQCLALPWSAVESRSRCAFFDFRKLSAARSARRRRRCTVDSDETKEATDQQKEIGYDNLHEVRRDGPGWGRLLRFLRITRGNASGGDSHAGSDGSAGSGPGSGG
jgi:hypothetical protein